ncbi:TonB-dependent receptor [Pseudoalteromonas denitrificans]|uniref:Iron complex outermembrane recepter protein n=1 Tax=Pseudoalteromonas denitrificans DSM 6059 TaxID=1123010 RepID=A0A1I1SSF7_9GAMM|nr:TonB-dependent receptor [Pseudoalteromonas denitrificans]SFD49367.1 iron complex outermembrane recepter protein [Pseudoalteromonas denitrificans DSM 6059]
MKAMKKTTLAVLINAALFSAASHSAEAETQEQIKAPKLEVISVTARKRVENAQEIPVSVSALQGDNLEAYSSAGMDIRFMNAKIPSLSVESSFGRSFPRFYVRGLGNTDFDLNASQPVSLVVDEVVQENPILKGFPVFDMERVEVLRGPQGTLFGRNTPAGLVKFDSVKPSEDTNGYLALSYGTLGAVDFEGAVGTSLTDNLSVRISGLHQEKDDYIDNRAVGFEQKDALGGYEENATRIQFLYEANDFSALLNYHYRDLDGKPIVFHTNIAKPGSNKIRKGFDADVVYQDAAQFATQQVTSQGASLKMEWELSDTHTLTSISAWESAEIYSRADVDGGYLGDPTAGDPNAVWWGAQSADAIPDHNQYTQELRLSSNLNGPLNYQTGLFYYNEDLTIDSYDFVTAASNTYSACQSGDPLQVTKANSCLPNGFSTQDQKTTAYAVFGSVDYDVSDDLAMTVGVRYSHDKKDFTAQLIDHPFIPGDNDGNFQDSANPSDSHVSWDVSGVYKLTDDVNVFARLANSFRAPSVQGRILYDQRVSVADSETINSFETGIKSDVLDGRGRVNATVYYFEMSDQQLTAVGGGANSNTLLNADKTVGYGFELDTQWILTDEINATFNVSYNDTEIQDSSLSVGTCGSGTCTVTNALNADGRANIDGNSLPNSPEWIANFTLRYATEVADGEFFAYTDWSYRSDINFFLYQAEEFNGEALFEGGIRAGYNWESGDNEYQVSAFVRNITDEQVIIGGVDFNNNSGMVNEARYVGAEFKVNFF